MMAERISLTTSSKSRCADPATYAIQTYRRSLFSTHVKRRKVAVDLGSEIVMRFALVAAERAVPLHARNPQGTKLSMAGAFTGTRWNKVLHRDGRDYESKASRFIY